jgi:SAM-dependent methyltransferase
MSFKDLFSAQASDYALFRPRYPDALFKWLSTLVPQHRLAVDVGAGNGQAATALAAYFERVVAIDPSASQLAHAASLPNVDYRRAAAEETGLDPGGTDLLVAAQAFHWFDHRRFFSEAQRVIRPGGALAVWCYGLTRISPEIDALVFELYETHLGAYWDPERRLVESGYRSVQVPFAEMPAPPFEMHAAWTLRDLIGYLGTWSALEHYLQARGPDGEARANPLEEMFPRLERAWGAHSDRTVTWPLSVRAFRPG